MYSCLFTLLACTVVLGFADKLDLYDTKLATSDLQWNKNSNSVEQGWEEVSSFDETFRSTIRSYQVCDQDDIDADNWIRSPYIQTRGGNQIYLEVEFSISLCNPSSSDQKGSCKETFNIYYYEANSDVASSTYPPWQEHPYKKVDTVAANKVNGINTKTFNFGPVSRKGFYIAVQDQGACMSLISLRAYYHYCPATIRDLVSYPRTVAEPGIASLATATGKCISHAILNGDDKPQYRCSSDGQWQIATGKCLCQSGYQSNSLRTNCFVCPIGTYKLETGYGRCTSCPEKSGHVSGGELDGFFSTFNSCPCFPGYSRAPGENVSVACSGPPSEPLDLKVAFKNATSALLRWSSPADYGGRNHVFFTFQCQTVAVADVENSNWKNCSTSIYYLAPSRDGKFYENFVRVFSLRPYRNYKVAVYARNDAFPIILLDTKNKSASSVIFQTDEDVPSVVRSIQQIQTTATSVKLTWTEPEHANGVILNYQLQLYPLTNSGTSASVLNGHNMISRSTSLRSIDLTSLSVNKKYMVRIRARTSAGFGPFTDTIIERRPTSTASKDRDLPLSVLIILVFLCIFISALSITVVFRYRKTGKLLCLKTTKKGKRLQNEKIIENGLSHPDCLLRERLIVDLPTSEYRTYVDYPDPHAAIIAMELEIDPKSIKTGEVVGLGEFAEVCFGKLTLPDSTKMDVAVKRLKGGANRKDQMNFLREASTVAQFDDPNIICLRGVVTKCEPVMIVTEYMENKSLDGYLKLNKGKLSIIQLVKMLKGIASGMRYLSNMKYIHRDLAARNILVDTDLNCKVSDFGLSRTLENNPNATYTTQGGKIAIRWTALESIIYRKFTSASDVWSYGIVMWEVTSYGEKPYWDMSNDDVITNLESGMRLPAPMGCPKVLHEMMLRCWQVEPQARPTFSNMTDNLHDLLGQPSQLLPDVACHAALPSTGLSRRAVSNPNCSLDVGGVVSVDDWLKIQNLANYSQQFRIRGVDNLEKVCNLTLNDLKLMGIDVTLHINKLENGIRNLKRHLSSSSSTPPPTPLTPILEQEDDQLINSSPS